MQANIHFVDKTLKDRYFFCGNNDKLDSVFLAYIEKLFNIHWMNLLDLANVVKDDVRSRESAI